MSASSALRGRRFHQKSRNGCQQCKRRKVKCDEKKPVCDKCRRYGVDCSFAPANRIRIEEAVVSSRRSISSDRNTTSCSSSRPSRRGSPRWIPVENPHTPLSAGFELAIADLELLHHYTTSTAYTFSLHPALQTLWRVEVPRIGFTAPYTLRAILAISALHLAVLRPGKRELYIAQASEHHDAALRLATPAIPNINHENVPPLFLFSALSSFICCAKPLKLGNFLLWEDHEIADWLLLIKGTGSIIESSESAKESLHSGPLGIIFSVHRQSYSLLATQHEFLENLRCFILNEMKDSHGDESEVYNAAIDHLSHCFTICLDKGCRLETAEVFLWLLRVPQDFLLLLKGHQPHALVIVGYFCVLLHQLEWMWWMKNWGTHILSQIYHLLPGPIYKAWLQWPMEQIGFVPFE
ncbi:Zn(II)2Cys6 transcription factor [Aspergillus foveolatus]|uniref:Zn(II)2Cys6 transcription factor n=1 Tax=Aspergillus foveolatus TaxID=210207 RepID=UPI003CCE282C